MTISAKHRSKFAVLHTSEKFSGRKTLNKQTNKQTKSKFPSLLNNKVVLHNQDEHKKLIQNLFPPLSILHFLYVNMKLKWTFWDITFVKIIIKLQLFRSPTCKLNYVNIQHVYVDMHLIYVKMQWYQHDNRYRIC